MTKVNNHVTLLYNKLIKFYYACIVNLNIKYYLRKPFTNTKLIKNENISLYKPRPGYNL